ncbi:MAG: hypothetical protein ACE5I1_10420, partial [bacterium]
MKSLLEIIGSPYSAVETFIRWPFYHFFPSTKNPTGMHPQPLPFFDDSFQNASVDKVLFFGDL